MTTLRKKSSTGLFVLSAVAGMAVLFTGAPSYADETVGEKAGEVKDDTVKHSKKAGRKAKKAGNDMKDKASDAGDEVSDKADDVKKKVD